MMVMWLPVVASLSAVTLLPQVESPSLHCPYGEYSHSVICCKLCPAGTHVKEHCDRPHSLGRCKSCTNGESYTEHENGSDQCFSCLKCKSGFKLVQPCTVTKNTECQCKDGTFLRPGYEECMSCKAQCPEGQVIVKRCNATADMECGLPNTGSMASSLIWIISTIIIVLILFPFSLWLLCKKRKSCSKKDEEKEEAEVYLDPNGFQSSVADTFIFDMRDLISGNTENLNSNAEASAASQHELSEPSEGSSLGLARGEEDSSLVNLSSVPPALESAVPNEHSDVRNQVLRSNKPKIIIKNPSSKELKDTYYTISDMVGPTNWRMLMRKCDLPDNDIDKTIYDNQHSIDEQRYQMLRTLRDRSGIAGALYKILNGLQEMNLNGIYENLVNELKRQDLITMETED